MMEDRRKIAFEENTLTRKSVKKLFVRNSQRKIELEHFCRQLDKAKEDRKAHFVKDRFELLHQLKQRRFSLTGAPGMDGAQSMGSECFPRRFSHTTEKMEPSQRKARSKTFCFDSPRHNEKDQMCGIKSKSKSLSEILPPIMLPPVHSQQRGMACARATHKDMLGISTRRREKAERPVAIRSNFDDLSDCRYLRGPKGAYSGTLGN